MTEANHGFTTGAGCMQASSIQLIVFLMEKLTNIVCTKLRLHRKYSIKIMLPWGTCCRFPFFMCHSPFEIRAANHRLYYPSTSPWIWDFILIPGNIYHCWYPGTRCLYPLLIITAACIRLFRPYHPQKMPGRLRSYGMDKAAIWRCDCVVLEPLDVRHMFHHL